jgi:hypothetical protein
MTTWAKPIVERAWTDEHKKLGNSVYPYALYTVVLVTLS